jgi:hypothetical protein
VKVTIVGGALNGLTAGFLIKVEELTPALASVRLFHTSVTRANATWPGWPGEPGFTGDFAEYVAQEFPSATSADFAVVEAGIVSEETYVEQGLYWETGYRPLIQYILETYRPDLLRNQVIGTQQFDIRRAPTRLFESAMGNLVADAMRQKYPGVDAALTNSGGLRSDLNCDPPSVGEASCEITWGEVFAVLPFGNRTVIETLTGAQLETAFLNGFSTFCNPAIATGRFPQVSGLAVTFACSGTSPVVTGMWLAPDGPGGVLTPIGPADSVRIVTNDFMFSGGDGYTVLSQGTDVQNPGDDLLQVTVEHITANSPVGPVVEGRIVGP